MIDPAFTWGIESRPRHPLDHSLIDELHVRGLQCAIRTLPQPLRGTFAALPAADRRLPTQARRHGRGALPVHGFVHDRHLVERRLRDDWGSNSIGFFAPHPKYLGPGALGEVKTFVQVMHDVGIEVILDVV